MGDMVMILEAMKQALDALENYAHGMGEEGELAVCADLRTAIIEMERAEPVAWMVVPEFEAMVGEATSMIFSVMNVEPSVGGVPLYTHPIVTEGWLRAVDEEMVVCHLGVANESDDYETASKKLHELIQWHVDVALDPAVNGGWQLVPVEPTDEMCRALWRRDRLDTCGIIWERVLQAAPKPEDV